MLGEHDYFDISGETLGKMIPDRFFVGVGYESHRVSLIVFLIQCVDLLRKIEVVFGYAAGGVRPVQQGDFIVVDKDVGVMIERLGQVSNRVHEGHSAKKILELVFFLNPVFTP